MGRFLKKNQELSNAKKGFHIVKLSGMCVYAIVNLVLVILAFQALQSTIDLYEDLVNNWNSEPIYDVRVVAGNSDCPSGFEPANDYGWDGTMAGCDCSHVSSSLKTSYKIDCDICQGSCSTNETRAGCDEIDSTPSRDLFALGNIGTQGTRADNRIICVERGDETFIDSATKNKNNGDCPSGYTECGDETKYCTKESKCPITNWRFSSNDCDEDESDCDLIDVNGGDEIYMRWERGDVTDALPIAQIRLNEHGMCKRFPVDNRTPGRVDFTLRNDDRADCGTVGSERYISQKLEIEEERLFIINEVQDKIQFLIDDYDFYKGNNDGTDYSHYLFARRFISFAFSCREDLELVRDSKDEITNLESAQLGLVVITSISSFALAVVLGLMEIANLCGYDLPCFAGDGEEERKKLNRFKRIWSIFFRFIVLPFLLWAVILTGSTKELFTQVTEDGCFDDIYTDDMEDLAATLRDTDSKNIAALAMNIFFILLGFFFHWLDLRKQKKEKEKSKVTPTNKPSKQDDAKPDDNNNNNNNSTARPFNPSPTNNNYPAPGGFNQSGGPPPQGGGFPQQQGGWNPNQQGGYPPQQGGWNPNQQQGGYPQQQGGWQGPPQQGGITITLNPGQQQQQQPQ